MANKKISELVSRTPSLTDLMLVGDPSSGYSYKCTITELSTLLEANITLNDLNNVVITAPTNGQVLTYNGTNWVNGNNGITEINGLTATSQSFAVGTSGTDFAIVSSISTHTFNLPTASATNRGALSSADWSTFNSKIGGSGTTNYLSKFTGTSTIGNSLLFDNGTNVGIGTINPSTKLDVNGDVKISTIANATTDTDRFLVSDSGVIKYRTGSEVLSDIGGAAASSISGTTNYIPKFSASGSINNSQLYQDGNLICIGTTTGSSALTVNGDITLFNGRGVFGKNIAGTGNSFSLLDTGLVFSEYMSDPVLQSSPSISNITLNSNGSISLGNIAAATTDTDRFIVSDSGVIKYRTGSQVLSDIGGASASSISGTTNYIPKFTSSSAIGNSQIFDNGTNVGIGTISGGAKLEIYDASSNSILRFNSGTNNSLRGLEWYNNNSSNIYGSIKSDYTSGVFTYDAGASVYAGTHVFRIGTGGEAMRLDASGNLGLGTSNPNTRMHVAGSLTINDIIYLQRSSSSLYLPIANYWNGSGSPLAGTKGDILAIGNAGGDGLVFVNGNVERARIDASGNLGLGVTPSAWWSGFKAIQIGTTGALVSGSGVINLGNNYYFDGTNVIYLTSSNASFYQQNAGQHIWYNAPSGTAGNTISFTQAMTLDASGNLFLGATGTSLNSVRGIAINGGATNDVQLRLQNNNTGTSGSDGILLSLDGSSNAYLWNYENAATLFGTNNTERMRITSGGNVGIGTTNPDRRLTIQSGQANATSTTYTGGLLIHDRASGTTPHLGAGVAYNGGNEHSWIQSNSSIGAQALALNPAGGNVGIGTTNPASLFHVSGGNITLWNSSDAIIQSVKLGALATRITTTSSALTFGVDGSDGSTERMRITSGGNVRIVGGGDLEIYPLSGSSYSALYNDNDNFSIWNNGSERMRITSGGNVGIGTTSPTAGLTLNNATEVRFRMNIADVNQIILNHDGSTGLLRTETATPLVFGTYGSEQMRITSGGNVGIGTTSPQAYTNYRTLEIENTTGAVIRLKNTTATGLLEIAANSTETYYKNISNTPLTFGTNNAERMRITSGGNVGIGTTNPTEKLEVNGSIKTAAPSGGTAKPWKFGAKVIASPSVVLDTGQYIEVEIDGIAYKLGTVILS